MHTLHDEIRAFRQRRSGEHDHARQLMALQLCAGMDMEKALEADGAEQERIILRLQRLLERERLRGMRRHWSYDLNRHISLKQALDLFRAQAGIKQKGQRSFDRCPLRSSVTG